MKVKELIEILQKEDPELEIVLASDMEGNSFSSFSSDDCIGHGYWDENNLEYYNRDEEDAVGIPVLSLWP